MTALGYLNAAHVVLCPAVVHSEAGGGVSAEPSLLEDDSNASSLAIQPVIVPLRTLSPDIATTDTHGIGTYVVSTGAGPIAEALPEPGLILFPHDQGSNSQQPQSRGPVSIDSQHSGRASGETALSQAAADSAAGSVLISSAAKASSDAQLSAPSWVGSMSRVSSGHRSVSPASHAAIATADDGQAQKDDSVHDNVSQPSADSQTSSRRSSRIGSPRQQPVRSPEPDESAATAGISNTSASNVGGLATKSATSSATLAGTAGLSGESPAACQLEGAGSAVTGRGTTAASSSGNGTGPVMGAAEGRRSRGSSAGRASTSSSRLLKQDSSAASAEFTGDAAVPAPTNSNAQPAAETAAASIDRADSMRQDATASAVRQGASAHSAQNNNGGLAESPEESQGHIGLDAEGSHACVSPDLVHSQSPSHIPLGPIVQSSQDIIGLTPKAAADTPKTEGSMVGASLSQLGKEGGAGVIRHSVILTSLDPLEQWMYTQPGMLPALDYDKIKTDLQVAHSLPCQGVDVHMCLMSCRSFDSVTHLPAFPPVAHSVAHSFAHSPLTHSLLQSASHSLTHPPTY